MHRRCRHHHLWLLFRCLSSLLGSLLVPSQSVSLTIVRRSCDTVGRECGSGAEIDQCLLSYEPSLRTNFIPCFSGDSRPYFKLEKAPLVNCCSTGAPQTAQLVTLWPFWSRLSSTPPLLSCCQVSGCDQSVNSWLE